MSKSNNDPLFRIDGRDGLWAIDTWCAQFGCSVPWFYGLQIRPKEVRIGRKVRLIESPAAYLERVRLAQLEAERTEQHQSEGAAA